MTGSILYDAIKYWLPLLTLGVAIFKAFRAVKKGVSAWAGQLLDNHMAHIQSSAESAVKVMTEISETNRMLANAMVELRSDFQRHYVETERLQQAIVTGIEVLKDR